MAKILTKVKYCYTIFTLQVFHICLIVLLPGDNTEKIWAHWFLAKPKMIAAEGMGEL